jgi:hypothetical protein
MPWAPARLLAVAGSALLGCLALPASSPAVEACTGDCDLSGTVAASEIVLAVRSSLHGVVCAAADANHDGAVSIDELIATVVSSFTDCGNLSLPTATPTFTPTPLPTATPTPTPTEAPPLRVDGLWREDDARLVSTGCDPLVDEVRLQLFSLRECDFPIVQNGDRASFRKDCRPDLDYEADVDAQGTVTGTAAIRAAQQGCRIDLDVRYSYAMGSSPTTGDYTLRWQFSSSCRPLQSCEQVMRTTLTRIEAVAPSFAPSQGQR